MSRDKGVLIKKSHTQHSTCPKVRSLSFQSHVHLKHKIGCKENVSLVVVRRTDDRFRWFVCTHLFDNIGMVSWFYIEISKKN